MTMGEPVLFGGIVLNGKIFHFLKKVVDNLKNVIYNMSCVTKKESRFRIALTGVWLSLARVLDLGSRGRRFESCHPDSVTSYMACGCSSMVEH